MTASKGPEMGTQKTASPLWLQAKAVERWWASYLSPSVPASGGLRGALRRAPDAAIMIDPHFVRLVQSVREARDHDLSFGEVQSLLGAARLVGLFRENGTKSLAEMVRSAGSDISLNRRKRLVSAESREEFHAQVARIQHQLPGTPRLAMLVHLFLTWPSEDARARFAFDALSQKV